MNKDKNDYYRSRYNILIIAGLKISLQKFRGDLIKSWINMGHNVSAAAPGLDSTEIFGGLDLNCFDLPIKRASLNPLSDLFILLKMILLIKRIRPDKLFLYTVKPVIYGSLAAYLFPRIKVYSMITGLGYAFTDVYGVKMVLHKILIILYRIALARNSKVFFQNPDDAELFTKLRLVKNKQIVLTSGSGVNLEHYTPVPLKLENIVFLLIARLLKEKGIREYINAARIIKKKYPKTFFSLVGWPFADNPSAICHAEVERWKDEGVVEIAGETDDVRPYIAQANVYVLPSYREGTPRTVLEAMAMGRAIITTDTAGCRETVIEGVNGYLVPVKNVYALAEAMERFILKPELIPRMGKESRKLVEIKFNVHKVNDTINRAMEINNI